MPTADEPNTVQRYGHEKGERHFYAKGSEYKKSENDVSGMIVDEERALQEIGRSKLFTDDIVFSSSDLLNQFSADFPEETRNFFQTISKLHGESTIFSYIDNARSLKVLVIGEAILDEYNYCDMVAVAAKDPAIVVRYLAQERYAMGMQVPA